MAGKEKEICFYPDKFVLIYIMLKSISVFVKMKQVEIIDGEGLT